MRRTTEENALSRDEVKFVANQLVRLWPILGMLTSFEQDFIKDTAKRYAQYSFALHLSGVQFEKLREISAKYFI